MPIAAQADGRHQVAADAQEAVRDLTCDDGVEHEPSRPRWPTCQQAERQQESAADLGDAGHDRHSLAGV